MIRDMSSGVLGEDYYITSAKPVWTNLVEALSVVKEEFEYILGMDGTHPLFRGVDFRAHLTDLSGAKSYDRDNLPPEEIVIPSDRHYSELGKAASCWLHFVDESTDEDGESGDIVLNLSRKSGFNCNNWLVIAFDIRLSRWESLIRALRKSGILSEEDADDLEWSIE
ncbi:hypothetical protein IJJ18_02465 [Candidatus Saccharibacteria bacterium]|nr:hypothetical protein [Candidatus Saccharibacteria bacterium]